LGAAAFGQPLAARAFDRVAAGERYRRWHDAFRADVRRVIGLVPRDEEITAEHVEKICERSVVPGSRTPENFAVWLNQQRQQDRFPRTSASRLGFLRVVDLMLEDSIPAGQGGLFPEPAGSAFPDKTLTVWYMHVHGGELLDSYFANPERFKPYRLPPEGTLARKAFPFLLFEDSGSSLRLGGFSAEWMGAVERMYSIQFT
jgi:hypothetical protein